MADNGLGYITELSATDVLFGRGSGPNDHEGNIRFRHLVAERKQEYLATNHRQTKAKIAREIVNKIMEDQGRFLKKVEHFEARRLGIPKGVDAWIIVDDDTVMEKAKQALRQNTNKGARGSSPSRGTSSPVRGNSPVRGVSPVRGQTSPIPGTSPVRRQQPSAMPTFEDLEPLPLGMNANLAAARAAVTAQQFAGMTLQQQQQAIQQQVQQQVQQQQQITAAQMAGLGGVGGVDPTALGWDQNRFAPNVNVAAQMAAAGGDWRGAGSNQGVILPGQEGLTSGGWAPGQQTMAPPQPRVPGMNNAVHPSQVQYSNSNGNWNAGSEQTTQPSASQQEDDKKRRQSLHVEDLMDSFSKLQTGDFSAEAKLQESTDTMGTIEPIGAYDSAMSVTSMSSSTFSIFKNAMGESTDEMPFSRGVSRSSSINESQRDNRGGDIDASMQSLQSIGSLGNLSEVWGTRGMSLLDRLVQEERERANLEGGGGGGAGGNSAAAAGDAGDSRSSGLADNPRPVGLMEEEPDNLNSLGTSSMSVMKAAFDSSRRAGDRDSKQDSEGDGL